MTENNYPMKKIIHSSLLFTMIIGCYFSSYAQAEMTNEKMHKIIKEEASEMNGTLGNWQLIYGERLIFIITDESNNRMRIFTPVLEEDKLEEGQLKKMLQANFHSALDAKYSLYESFVVSVFTHPLKELTPEQFVDAMQQVVILANTFGDTYSSTGLIFGGGDENEEEESEEEKRKKARTNKKPGKT